MISPQASFGERFAEAVEFFREKSPVFADDFATLDAAARARAFTVASVAQIDAIASVWRALDVALDSGQPYESFRDAILPILTSAWLGSPGKIPARIDVIFRTNTASAYNAGRYRQATHPDTVRLRPVWRFDALLDGRTTSICKTCHGTTLPADHPWWRTHISPLHHRCRSSFVTLRASQAGPLTENPPSQEPTGSFGSPPGTPWRPDPRAYPEPLRGALARATEPPPPAHIDPASLPERPAPTDAAPVPGGERAYARKNKAQIEALDPKQQEAISDFTFGYDWVVRRLDRGTDPADILRDLRKAWKAGTVRRLDASPEAHLEKGASVLHRLRQAYQALPASPGVAYRGLANLTLPQVETLLNQSEMALGAISSVSRDPRVAARFATSDKRSGHGVLLVIRHQGGRAIEEGSVFSSEKELLLDGNARFRLVSRHREKGNNRRWIVEIEQIP